MISLFRWLVRCALGAALVGVPLAVSAQTPSIPMPGEGQKPTWVNLSQAHLFKADIDNLSNAQVQRESTLLVVGHQFGEPQSKLKLVTQFSYQLSAYNFFHDDLGTLEGMAVLNSNQCDPDFPSCSGKLWSDTHQFTALGMASYVLNDDWSLLGAGVVRLAGEAGADWGEALGGGGFVGFNRRWSESLNVGVVVGVMSQLEETRLFALPLVNWKFAEEWRFDLGAQHLGGAGYGPKLTWAPTSNGSSR